MNYTILDNKEEGMRSVEVELPWSSVSTEYDGVNRDLQQLEIAGFRKGKAPRAFVERRFAAQIKDELIHRVCEPTCRDLTSKDDIGKAVQIEITDVDVVQNEHLKFHADFELLPDFDLPDYANIPLTSTDEDAQIDEVSQFLLENTDVQPPQSLIDMEVDEADGEDDQDSARDRAKLMLILQKIADADGIEVDEKDVELRIKNVAQDSQTTPEALKLELGISGVGRLRTFLLAEYTLDYLLETNKGTP